MNVYTNTKKRTRFIGTIVLLWVLIIALAVNASALDVTGLEATKSGDGSWDGTKLSAVSESCITGNQAKTATLNLKNTGYENAMLSFDFTVTNLGTLKIDGVTCNTNGSFSKQLAKNDTVTIELTSNGGNTNETSVTLVNVKLEEIANIDLSFKPGVIYTENADGEIVANSVPYNVNEKTVADNIASFEEISNTTSFALTEMPENYHLLYAVDDSGKRWFAGADGKLIFATKDDLTLTPHFIYSESTEAPFNVNGVDRWTWEAAVSSAVGGVVVVNTDYTLPTNLQANGLSTNSDYVSVAGGAITYTLPGNMKLLVPYKDGDAGTFSQQATIAESSDTPSLEQCHRLLTVGANTSIVVQGQMNVNGRQLATGKGYAGSVNGDFGWVKLTDPTASIVVEKGGALYCFGFISGDGTVTVKDGGEVTEMLQLRDWRGGNAASSWQGNYESFVFSQYFVQNVEARLIMQTGASSYVCHTAKASGVTKGIVAPFVGKNSGLFHLTEGELHRTYRPNTDRIEYEVYGQAQLSNINITIPDIPLLGTITMNSTDYILPLHNSMSVFVNEGKLEISNRIKLLPGVEIHVAEGAEAEMMEGVTADGDPFALYIYDESDWEDSYTKGSVGASKTRFSPSRSEYGGSRPALGSASIVNDGTVRMHGNVFTTSGGTSLDKVITGTGVIINDRDPVAAVLDEFEQGGTEEDEDADATTLHDAIVIPITPVLGNIVTGETLPEIYSSFGKDTYHGFYFDIDGDGEEITDYFWSTKTPVTVNVVDEKGNTLFSRPTFIVTGTTLSGYYADAAMQTAVETYNGETVLYTMATAYVDWADESKADTYFESFSDAYRAAERDNGAVHLLRDALVNDVLTVSATSNVSVYLGGNTLHYKGNLFSIYGTLNLNLEGGTITNLIKYDDEGAVSEIWFKSAIVVRNKGNLNLDMGGGVLEWTAPSSYTYTNKDGVFAPLYNQNVGNVNVDLNGGTIRVNYTKVYSTYTYSKIHAVYNYGIMSIVDSSGGNGLITNNAKTNYSTRMAATTGTTTYGQHTIYNTTNAELTLDGVKVTQTASANSRFSAAVTNYRAYLTIKNSTLTNSRAYALINAAGTVESISGSTLTSYYGIYNWNTRATNETGDGGYQPGYLGSIKEIMDSTVSGNYYGIRNRAHIGIIGGTTTIKATSGSADSASYAVYNYDTPAYDQRESSYVKGTGADGNRQDVYTYSWENIPTIDKITDDVLITGPCYGVLNQGRIKEISGNAVIGSTHSKTSFDNNTYSALFVSGGGVVDLIGGNVTVISGTATPSSGEQTRSSKGLRAIYINGQRPLTMVRNYDASGVKIRDSYPNNEVSRINEISGGTTEKGVHIYATKYAILNFGEIGKIGGKTTVYSSASSGLAGYNAGMRQDLYNDVYVPAASSYYIDFTTDDKGDVVESGRTYTSFKPSHIGIIGGENSDVLFSALTYPLANFSGASIDTIGQGNGKVELRVRESTSATATAYGLYMSTDTRVGTLGGAGSTVLIDVNTAVQRTLYGIYMADGAHIDVIGENGSTVTILKKSNGSYKNDAGTSVQGKKHAYGILLAKSGATIDTIAAPGSTVVIKDEYTSRGYGYGIYLTAETEGAVSKITTVGGEDPNGVLPNGNLTLNNGLYNFCVAQNAVIDKIIGDLNITRGDYGIYTNSNGHVEQIGSEKSNIVITAGRYGIYANTGGSYGTIGVTGTTRNCVKIKVAYHAIHSGKSIGEITDGVVAYTTSKVSATTPYYAISKSDAGIIGVISGGAFGRADATAAADVVSAGVDECLAEGYAFSSDTQTHNINGTDYPCYYVTSANVHTHTYGDPEKAWSEDGKTLTVSVTCTGDCAEGTEGRVLSASATGEQTGATEGDCQTKSSVTYSATVTVYDVCYNETNVVEGDYGTHTLEEVEAVDATCTEAGNNKYYICTVDNCGMAFKDDNATEETSVQDEVVSALGHTEVTVAGKAATCTETGLTDGVKCSVCDAIITAQTTVDALGHDIVIDAAVEATCTNTGLTEGQHCSRCDEATVEQTVVPVKAHTEVEIPAVAPTCTATGLTAGVKCSACGAVITAQTEVPATGHNHEAVVTDPTCTEEGYTTHTCACGDSYVTDKVAAKGHSWNGGEVTKDPTANEMGNMTYTCSACGETKTEDIEMKPAVAKIGEVNYETLSEAIAASEEGDEIVLLAKVTVEGTETWDLSGKTLTSFAVDENYSIVVKGDLTIAGGTFKINGFYGIGVTGKLTVTGGTFTASSDNDYLIGNWGTTTISGGEFNGVYNCVNNFDGTTTITGGKFTTEEYDSTKQYESADVLGDSGVAISGGTFSKPVEETHCDSGYIPNANGDGTFGVVEGSYVARIGDTKYTSLTAAIEAVSENATITLLEDVALTEKLVIDADKKITMSFGDHSLTTVAVAENYGFVVKGDLTIAGGTFNINGAYGIGVTGKLTVTDGTFNAAENNDYLIGNWGTTTISGGEFKGVYNCVNNFGGTTTIEGGKFSTAATDSSGEYESCDVLGDSGVAISGGSFSTTNIADDCFVAGYGLNKTADENGYYGVHKHAEETLDAVAPDCENSGLTAGTKCSVCDKVLAAQEEIEAKGHSMGDWIVDVKAGCETEGSKHKECANCDHTETETIPATGHLNTTTTTVDATCTAEGSVTVTCDDCDATVSTEVIEALGHTNADPVQENVVAATCTTPGSYDNVVKCATCGEELSRTTVTVDATGHRNTEIKDASDATCGKDGYTGDTYCNDCKSTVENGETIPATGEHTWDNGVETTPPTANAPGVKTYTCGTCGATRTEEIPATGYPVDTNLTFATKELSLGADIRAVFSVKLGKSSAYDSVYLEIEHNGETSSVEHYYIYGTNTKYYYFAYTLAAKQMADEIKITIYGVNEGSTICVSSPVMYSIKQGAIEMLDKWYGQEENMNKCILVANMLNYGAEAQKVFEYNLENLATDNLADEYLALIKTEVPEMESIEKTDNAGLGAVFNSYNLNLAEKVEILPIYKMPSSDFVLTDYYAVIEKIHVKADQTEERKTYTVNGEDCLKSGKWLYVYFRELASNDLRDLLSITLYKNGEPISEVQNFSVESVCKSMLNSYPTLIPALMNYGDCAKLVFD